MPMVRVRFRKKASLHRVHLPHVHGHGPQGLRHLEPIGHTVHGEDAGRPEEPRRLHRQKPHGTASDHGHHVSRADPSHLGAMIAGGQDVPQEDRLVVGQVVGDRLEHDVGERDADSLGLRPGVCLPEPAAEHGAPGGGALRREPIAADLAAPATDGERRHHAVPHPEPCYLATHGLHRADELVTQHDALLDVREPAVVEVQVRPADGAGGDANHRVRGLADRRIRHRLAPHVPRPVKRDAIHARLPCTASRPSARGVRSFESSNVRAFKSGNPAGERPTAFGVQAPR